MDARVEVFSANPNGTTGRYSVDLKIGDEFLFQIPMPSYVTEALGISGDQLWHETAKGAIEDYESACDRYSRMVLGKNAKRELFVQIKIVPGGMALRLHTVACEMADEAGDMQAVIVNPDGTIGDKIDLSSGRIIPDTEENRAQVQRLIASIDTAAQILTGLRDTADPVAYLHQIRNDFTLQPEQPVESLPEEDEFAL